MDFPHNLLGCFKGRHYEGRQHCDESYSTYITLISKKSRTFDVKDFQYIRLVGGSFQLSKSLCVYGQILDSVVIANKGKTAL